MTAYQALVTARRIIADLPGPVPADVLAQVLDADLSLTIAAALLLESRVVKPD